MKNSSPTNNFSLKKNKKLRTVFFFFEPIYSYIHNYLIHVLKLLATCLSVFSLIRIIFSLDLFTKTFPFSLFITPLFCNLYSFFSSLLIEMKAWY